MNIIIKEGKFFRTYSGLIGKIEKIVEFKGTILVETINKKIGKNIYIEVDNIKKCEDNLIELMEYDDVLKIYNKAFEGYFYYGFSKNKKISFYELVYGIINDEDFEIVTIIPKEALREKSINIKKNVCTSKEQETCQCEKMGCDGCFYNIN